MDFAPELISPLLLPSLPLEWHKGFPNCPAIYFAISGDKILYIGRASNLLKRWTNHHRYAELEQATNVKIAWMEVSDPLLLPGIEEALIQFFKPFLNKRSVKVRKLRGKPGNPNPTYKLKSNSKEPLAESPITVRLSVDLDKFVRAVSGKPALLASLPNRTEWLRRVIAEAVEKEWEAS